MDAIACSPLCSSRRVFSDGKEKRRMLDVGESQPKTRYSSPPLVLISHLLFLPYAVVGLRPSRCARLRELHITGSAETAISRMHTIASQNILFFSLKMFPHENLINDACAVKKPIPESFSSCIKRFPRCCSNVCQGLITFANCIFFYQMASIISLIKKISFTSTPV